MRWNINDKQVCFTRVTKIVVTVYVAPIFTQASQRVASINDSSHVRWQKCAKSGPLAAWNVHSSQFPFLFQSRNLIFFLMHFSWKHPVVEVWLFTPSSGKWKLGRELLGSRPLKATIISNFCMIWNISSSPILCFDPLLLPKTNDEYLACLYCCCQTNTNKTERDKRAVVFTVIYEVLLSFLTKMKILILQLWKFTWLCFIRLPVWFFLCYFSSPGREHWVCIESKRHRKEHPLCVTHRLMPPSTTLFQLPSFKKISMSHRVLISKSRSLKQCFSIANF